jgi:hypothetical protein
VPEGFPCFFLIKTNFHFLMVSRFKLCYKKKAGQDLLQKRRASRPRAPNTTMGSEPDAVGVGVAAGRRVAESWEVWPATTWVLAFQSWYPESWSITV